MGTEGIHKLGDWIALEQDGTVYTGQVTGIEHFGRDNSCVRYTVDVYADNKYHSKVSLRGDPGPSGAR